jgi:hypothetical protein
LFTANSFFHSTSPKTIAIDSQASGSLYDNTQLRAHRRAEKKRFSLFTFRRHVVIQRRKGHVHVYIPETMTHVTHTNNTAVTSFE